MSDQEGFVMYPDMAMLFFRVCSRYKLTALEDRKCVLRQLVKRKEAQYLRDVAPVLEGKKVLKIGFKTKGDKK